MRISNLRHLAPNNNKNRAEGLRQKQAEGPEKEESQFCRMKILKNSLFFNIYSVILSQNFKKEGTDSVRFLILFKNFKFSYQLFKNQAKLNSLFLNMNLPKDQYSEWRIQSPNDLCLHFGSTQNQMAPKAQYSIDFRDLANLDSKGLFNRWFNGDQLIIFYLARKKCSIPTLWLFHPISSIKLQLPCVCSNINLGHSFILRQSAPFAFPQLILQNAFQNDVSPAEISIRSDQFAPESHASSNLQTDKVPVARNSPILLNKNIIKEKMIKKPANRPATYLTERKYYLAQTIQEESNQNRKLRPRIFKKRGDKTAEKSTSHLQNALKLQEKIETRRDECGSSQIFEGCSEKKIEYRPLEGP